MDQAGKFKKFKKTPVLVGALFLALALAGFWYVYSETGANVRKAAEARLKWEEEANKKIQIKSLETLLGEMAAERSELDTHFATGTNIVPFLDSTQELASRVGAEAEILSVDVVEQNSLIITLEAEGSFEAIYKLTELLENSSYELEILTMDIRKETQAEGITGWKGFFKIKLISFLP